MKYNYFNFKPFGEQYLLTNDFGRYAFLDRDEFKRLIAKEVDPDSPLGTRLKENRFLYCGSDIDFSIEQEYALRDSKSFVTNATALHIFVVTTACNLQCVYCQANNGKCDSNLYMTEEIARRAVDLALQSPEYNLSFEFQGGEPLLNFPIIKFIVSYAEAHKAWHSISYSVVSNLTLLTEEVLDFAKAYNITIATSLDGSEAVHNWNRHYIGGEGSFQKVVDGVQRVRDAGLHVGAIETTTRRSLREPDEIVNTYAGLGFESVFIRPLTPLGRAGQSWDEVGYSSEAFLEFYEKAIRKIINLNREGTFFREDHATIFLKRIFGTPINYMELRSPCGGGIGQLAYYADGNVFTCDEGRMLFEMGDSAFKVGTVYESSYKGLICNGVCKTVCASSILESLPTCSDCVYQQYCGTCPVINYALTGDIVEKSPRNYRCRIYMGMLDIIFHMLQEGKEETVEILRSWIH